MDIGIEPPEPFADLRCAPGRLLLLQPHDQRLDLEGKLVGLTVRTGSIRLIVCD